MTKALERRAKLRESLILAGERRIAAGGLAGLKTRDLARDIGVANGAVYNLVEDMDELILRVGSHTLGRLDAALSAAETTALPRPRDAGPHRGRLLRFRRRKSRTVARVVRTPDGAG